MNLGAVKNGAILAGVMIGGGALVGGGVGAVTALNQEPKGDGLTTMEKRSTLANVIVGAGAGALAGVALVGAKKLINIPALKGIPLPAMLALGAGTGAATYGAFTLGRNALN